MAKKKESKPLTEEERLVRQEMLALQAEELRKKQQEIIAKRLKEKKVRSCSGKPNPDLILLPALQAGRDECKAAEICC